jgi:hypothetical protein
VGNKIADNTEGSSPFLPGDNRKTFTKLIKEKNKWHRKEKLGDRAIKGV